MAARGTGAAPLLRGRGEPRPTPCALLIAAYVIDCADEERSNQDSYLNESATRVRNAVTFPFSTLMSIFVTSATRKSRSEPAAVSTAFRPASSHDFSLTPTTSTIR